MLNIRKEEEIFANKILDYKEKASNKKVILTKFLDLREQEIISYLVNNDNYIKVYFNGGYQDSEMKRALFLHNDIPYSNDLFNLRIYQIEYNKKFLNISHRNILGTLMSLGITRDNIGDIIHNDDAYFITTQEISEFIINSFNTINKVPISLKEIPIIEFNVDLNYQEKNIIVNSLRLDLIISHTYNISRNKANDLIIGSFVKINHIMVDNNSYKCKINDIISVRTKGRMKILSINGKTKKDKISLKVGIL